MEFAVDLRMWSDSCAVLDLEVQPAGYNLWKNKAQAHLCSKHPSLGKLPEWAARQTEFVTEARHDEANSVRGGFNVGQVRGGPHGGSEDQQ